MRRAWSISSHTNGRAVGKEGDDPVEFQYVPSPEAENLELQLLVLPSSGPKASAWRRMGRAPPIGSATLARLFCGEATGRGLGSAAHAAGLGRGRKGDRPAVTYLQKRLHQVDFASHRKGGYPIGSGAIESAHRFIGHVA